MKTAISPKQVKVIQRRIEALNKAHVIRMSFVPSYAGLSELEKIPLRIDMAEIQAMKELMFGNDLDEILSTCVDKEYYCMAEGIKRVKAWAGTKDFV